MILINVWEGADASRRAQDYCELWGVDGTVLLDEAGDYAKALGIRGVPTNVLVDAEGIVRTVGAGNPEDLHAAVEVLLSS